MSAKSLQWISYIILIAIIWIVAVKAFGGPL